MSDIENPASAGSPFTSRGTGSWLNRGVSRRSLLGGAGAFGVGSLLAACGSSASDSGSSSSAKQVVITSSGGTYEDAWRKACWDPFTKETGIKVVPTVAKTDKLTAMLKSGDIQVDVLDESEFQFYTLLKANGVETFDYTRLTRTKKSDLTLTKDNYAGSIAYASVACYNTEAVKSTPQNWADIWNTAAFPGKRTFPDIASGSAFLEQALLAAGVAMDKLYPLDLDKAFTMFKQIKADVPKFFTSGAESTTLFDNKTAVVGGTWNSRIQDLITAGKPFAIQWNQSQRLNQGFGVMKGSVNVDAAYQLIDYSLQPEVLAAFAKYTGYGPLSNDAYDHIDSELAKRLPTSPDKTGMQFNQDPQWWAENLTEVQSRWQKMLLS